MGVIWQSAESYWTLIGIIVVAEMWRATSIMMIILVAGLQSIPDEYLEAAEIYGATLWQRVRRVIMPMLRPSLQVALILRIILAIQVFATAIALAGTGLTVMSQQTLEWANDIDNDNVAAAWAGLMLLMYPAGSGNQGHEIPQQKRAEGAGAPSAPVEGGKAVLPTTSQGLAIVRLRRAISMEMAVSTLPCCCSHSNMAGVGQA